MTDTKIAPQNLDGEEAVLGSLLIDGDAIGEVSWLKGEDFYREKNRWVYEACLDLYSKHEAINQITVAHAMRDKLEPAGGTAYLSHLINQTPTSVHLKHYAGVVKECSQKRQLIGAANKISAMGYDSLSPEDALFKSEQLLLKLREGNYKSKLISPEERYEKAVKRYDSLRTHSGAMFKYGFPWLDERTGGARAGNYIIVGARPQVGKSTLLWQIAESAAKEGHVLFASAEMSEEEVTDRCVAGGAGLPIPTVSKGNYSEETYNKLYDGIQEIPTHKIWVSDIRRMSTGDIRAQARELALKEKLTGVFVDYVQLLRDNPGAKAYERITQISAELKLIARELDVPLVAACQLNRTTEHGDKYPQLHELKESGALEQDADLVILLYRADVYINFTDPECPKGQAHLIVAKHRQGGMTGVKKLTWLTQSQRYGELAY